MPRLQSNRAQAERLRCGVPGLPRETAPACRGRDPLRHKRVSDDQDRQRRIPVGTRRCDLLRFGSAAQLPETRSEALRWSDRYSPLTCGAPRGEGIRLERALPTTTPEQFLKVLSTIGHFYCWSP